MIILIQEHGSCPNHVFCSLQKQKRGGGAISPMKPRKFCSWIHFFVLFCFVFPELSVSFHACLLISQLKHILEKITDGRLLWQRNITS